jgi:D-glycerate 3-kinase
MDQILPIVIELLKRERIDTSIASDLALTFGRIAENIASRHEAAAGTFMLGLCGPQGSGKSTLTMALREILTSQNSLSVAAVSLDDFYLTRSEREQLAAEVNPLLLTRGVPGTHDVRLAHEIFSALLAADSRTRTPLPIFDKAIDDRAPMSQWPVFVGRPDIILFEGWCVGATAEPAAALEVPINAFERREDADGAWRRHVNQSLIRDYQPLFSKLDGLLLLRAPGFDEIFRWRREQEQKLAERMNKERGMKDVGHLMDDKALKRFISHYERLTRHILQEMPSRADIVVSLSGRRKITDIAFRRSCSV